MITVTIWIRSKMKFSFRCCLIAWLVFGSTPDTFPQFNCAGVRFYQTRIEKTCLSNKHTEILVVTTDSIGGFALARADLEVQNRAHQPGTEIIWGQCTRLIVGQHPEIASEIGDDVGGDRTNKYANFGYGFLVPNDTIRLTARRVRSDAASRDSTEVTIEGRLSYWIEDPNPGCQKQDIIVASFLSTRMKNDPHVRFIWPKEMAHVISASMNITDSEQEILIHGTIEGSPQLNPYTTSSDENGALEASLWVDGSEVSRFSGVMPGSQGQGHLIVSNTFGDVLSGLTRGRHTFELKARRDFDLAIPHQIQTGPGDAMIGLVRLHPDVSHANYQPGETINKFKLKQNYPNPFNPQTILNYEIIKRSRVQLKIFDSNGREIITLVDSVQQPGRFELRWNGADQAGTKVSSGTYFCRLQTEDSMQTIKLNFIR